MAAPAARHLDRVAGSLAPYVPGPTGTARPDVAVRFDARLADPVVEHLGDAGDGLHTSWDGRGLRLEHEGAACRLRFDDPAAAALLQLEPGFPWWRAWAGVARPLLSIPIAARGAVVAHASAVTLDGRGIAIAGWAESGKTEVALALCERGARFVSDKWTALATDGTLHAMPVAAGLRAWTVPHLPQLRRSLSAAQRTRAAAGRTVSRAVERAGGRAGGRAATAAVGAARGAAGLAGRVSLSPAELRDAGDSPWAELELLVLLRASAGAPAVRELDREQACRRLLTTTAYEQRPLDELDARARYCGGAGIAGYGELRAREEQLLGEVLAGCRVVELAAPFPADPMPAADAVLAHLRQA